MVARCHLPGAFFLTTLMLCAPSGDALATAITVDVKCNGKKIGTFTVDVTGTGGVHPLPPGHAGVDAKGNFKLTATKPAVAECWCRDYFWFQTVHVSDSNYGPAFGTNDFVDAKQGSTTKWAGNTNTEDYRPFYFSPGKGKCDNGAMRNHPNTLDFQDQPTVAANRATAGNPFTWEATLCVGCVNDEFAPGDGRNTSGSFKILSCIRWGFKVTFVGGAQQYQVDRIGPAAVGSLPQSSIDALAGFNGKDGVGTWTIDSTKKTCPPPPEIPQQRIPGQDFPGCGTPSFVRCDYDSASETLAIEGGPIAFLDDAGVNGPTSPRYAGDPVLAARLGGGTFHLAQRHGNRVLFTHDPNGLNLYFDDPDDAPDSKSVDEGLFVDGNPNGWEEYAIGRAAILVYDPSLPIPLYGVVTEKQLDGTHSLFIRDLEVAVAAGNPITYYYAPGTDLAAATNNFTTSGSVLGTAYLATASGAALMPGLPPWGLAATAVVLAFAGLWQFRRVRGQEARRAG